MKHSLSFGIIVCLFVGLCGGLSLGLFHTSVQAISVDSSQLNLGTDCNISDGEASFTGLLSVPTDTYSVYARLPVAHQKASVQVYGEMNDGSGGCITIGATTATGDAWTLIGSWNGSDVGGIQTVFDVASTQLSSTLDANRPSIMLVSETHPTCIPTTECSVTINGEQGDVRPIGTLPNEDSLHIVRPIEPSTDRVLKVVYYVDNTPVYTKPTLQPFDLRYVTLSNQPLERVIQYASGQQIILKETAPPEYQDNFMNFLFRIVQSNPKLFTTIGWIVGIAALGGIIVGIEHTIRRRHMWRLAHGFIHENIHILSSSDVNKAFFAEHRRSIIKRIILGVIGVGILMTIVVILNTFVFTLYKVDGHSMEETYHNGSEQLVNKVPVSLAHLAGHDYTPPRGQVIIIRQIFGVTDDTQSVDKENQYLIKRVIGLPGERVVVRAGKMTIYNADNPNGFDPDAGSSWAKTGHADVVGPDVDVTLANNEIFICGDNRPESIDSRFNGPILTKQIIGTVF